MALGAAAAATLLPATAARAQAAPATVVPHLRIKLGIFNPGDSSTRAFAGGTLPNGEIDASVPESTSSGTSMLSIGYTEGRKDGRDFRDVPIGLSEVNFMGNPASGITGNVYLGGGAALHIIHVGGDGESSDKKVLGVFLQGGYQTPTSFFIEAKYYIAGGTVDGLKTTGLAIFLGKKI